MLILGFLHNDYCVDHPACIDKVHKSEKYSHLQSNPLPLLGLRPPMTPPQPILKGWLSINSLKTYKNNKKASAALIWHKQFTKALQYCVMQAVKENLVVW